MNVRAPSSSNCPGGVDDKGTFLFYEDSGPPTDSAKDYLTIVCVHGYLFNGATFKPTFAYAAEHNLRLITLNLRGYRGSSIFDATDRAAFTSQNKDDHANALLKQAREIAAFLAYIIETNSLPPPKTNSEGRTTGGLVLLTWSAGNALLLSLLANVTSLDAEVRSLLERYLRSAVMFDCPSFIYGVATPTLTSKTPFASSPETFVSDFLPWVSAYWSPMENISSITETTLETRQAMHTMDRDPRWLPTAFRVSKAELNEIAEPAIAPEIGSPFTVHLDVLRANTIRALFDTDGVWPQVNVVVLWSNMCATFSTWGARTMGDMLANPPVECREVRRISMHQVEDANHFAHYDQPEKFVRVLMNALN